MMNLDPMTPFPFWRPRRPDAGVVMAFSTRRGGVSTAPYTSLNLGLSTDDPAGRVQRNRELFLVALNLDPARLTTAGQVHGARVVEVSAPGHARECDALVTSASGLALAVAAADCAPLLLQAPGWVAAAHAGWRGTADRLPAIVVEALCLRAGVGPEALRVAIGPCIGACCYEVGPEVARRFPQAAVTMKHSRHHVDLSKAIGIQLMEAGVAAAGLFEASACTACDPDLYFSHRRDAGLTGRQWGVIALRGALATDPGGREGGEV